MKRTMISLISCVVFVACDDGGGTSDATLVEDAVAAHGGADALLALGPFLVVEASGQQLELAEGFTPQDPPALTADFRLVTRRDLIAGRDRFEWESSIHEPFPAELRYAEVIDARASTGFVEGPDGAFVFVEESPQEQARIAARLKQQRLASGVLLLALYAGDPASVRPLPDAVHDGRTHRVLEVDDPTGPVRLFLDPETLLTVKIESVEDDPFFGDVRSEILFSDWRPVQGVQIPFAVEQRVGGETILTETRTSVVSEPMLDPALFEVPAEHRLPADGAETARGAAQSQWLLRRHASGVGGFALPGAPMIVELTPEVFHVRHATHFSLVVERADHLVVIEAPLDEAHSLATLAALEARFPGKPVRTVVNTHFHYDHAGGLRTYVAAGAELVTAAVNREVIDRMLAAPHTVRQDALGRTPRTQTIREVVGSLVLLGEPAVALHEIDNGHSQGMLIAHVPRHGVLFNADLYTPVPFAAAEPEPRRSWAAELVAAIESLGLEVEIIAGAHGVDTGTMESLRIAAGLAVPTGPTGGD